jgi:hypothetical protein
MGFDSAASPDAAAARGAMSAIIIAVIAVILEGVNMGIISCNPSLGMV